MSKRHLRHPSASFVGIMLFALTIGVLMLERPPEQSEEEHTTRDAFAFECPSETEGSYDPDICTKTETFTVRIH